MRAIKRRHTTKYLWAIETGLTGRTYLFNSTATAPAMFSTRRRARIALATYKSSYTLPDAARAVRVSVTVTTIGRG